MSDVTEFAYWVFNGKGGVCPSGVFSSRETAHAWIEEHRLSGTLTGYRRDTGVYQWAVAKGYFSPKKTAHTTSEFIGSFSDASQPHYHYVDGVTRD